MERGRRFYSGLRSALPVIFFFVTSFLFLRSVFGLQYTITVPPMAAFFSAKLRNGENRYLILLFHETLILILAALGALNLCLLVFLNILLPFILVFTQSSRFNPRGYYAYMLLYVYLSFSPPQEADEFMATLASLWFLTLYMAVLIWICRALRHSSRRERMTLQAFLSELSALVMLLAEEGKEEELRRRFDLLRREVTDGRKSFSALRSRESEIENMASALLQRFSYMLSEDNSASSLDSESVMELRMLSVFLMDTSALIGTEWQDEQLETARQMLDGMSITEERVRIFSRSIIHMIELMLITEGEWRARRIRRRIDWKNLGHEINIRFSTDSFEMRLALRLSIVMALSGIADALIPASHSYWITLNAFILMQPGSEECSYQMKANTIGTFIGCLAEYIIQPFLPGSGAELVFALVMISLMYASSPGTWYHPVFHTCYTLTVALMTLDGTSAIALRLLCLLIALVIVFAVNRFFFPIRRASQFRYGVKALFRLHNSYWNVIKRELIAGPDFSVSSDILSDFHQHYEEALAYMKKHPADKYHDLEDALLILWHMLSELEQIHYLVMVRAVRDEEREDILSLITAIQKDLYPIIRAEDFPDLRSRLDLQRPDVAKVVGEYLKNAERLLLYKTVIPF